MTCRAFGFPLNQPEKGTKLQSKGKQDHMLRRKKGKGLCCRTHYFFESGQASDGSFSRRFGAQGAAQIEDALRLELQVGASHASTPCRGFLRTVSQQPQATQPTLGQLNSETPLSPPTPQALVPSHLYVETPLRKPDCVFLKCKSPLFCLVLQGKPRETSCQGPQ